jgi:uncharacterized protein DUF4145
MKCPHCAVTIHGQWYKTSINFGPGSNTGWLVQIAQCPACNRMILQAQEPEETKKWFQFFPKGSNRGPVPNDVPNDIAEDYNQAALVLSDSPKASAALSRRCLQAILREAGYKHKDLAQQIAAVLSETDARKALPTGVHSTLDAIRNFGNFSAHPITDQTTLQIIDVEPHEAESCLDILDALFDHYYTRPAVAKTQRQLLDAKLAAAKKPPSKK